ncbi:MAG: sugar ABC transporter ATP-binding protein [Clostridium sp.]|jgi:ABC-type sugar transport system ATPase subunit
MKKELENVGERVEDIVLKMTDISKSFGGVHALNGIHFELRRGEIHALLGENGAGKSTLIKVLGGIYHPDRGTIEVEGKNVEMDSVQTAREHGIGIIHQEIVLVPHLTVAENIFLGREILGKFGLRDVGEMTKQAGEMLKALGLDIDPETKIVNLTIAQQQMVEIVKASSFHVKILVMDEPTSSLSDEEVEKLFETMTRLKEQGVSIIYISHRMEELFRMTDRITVIRDGTYVGTVNTGETTTDQLVAMMVGRSLQNYYTRDYDTLKKDQIVLKVEHLTRKGVFQDISFQVRAGEILGFAGLVGAGRSEIMTCVFGADRFDEGDIYLEGKRVRFKNCLEAINSGIAMVTEDRKKTGLTLINSIEFNTTLSSLRYYESGFLLSDKKKKEVTQEYIKSLNIKALSPDAAVGSMSGGNQQKVVIAKALATKPKLLILDEPTRGVDVGAKAEIYAIINRLAREGMAIVMISSELPEIINMCDNVCVIKEGIKTGEISHLEVTQERIMKLATGV